MTAKQTTAAKAKTAVPKKAAAKKAAAKAPAKKLATTASKPKAAVANTAGSKSARLSALDAAAQVLARSKEPLNCRQLILFRAERGLWKSQAGESPDRTV